MDDMCFLFNEERKRFCGRWNITLWLSLIILLLLFGALNIANYKSLSAKEAKFMEIQDKYFLTIPNYTVYSIKGISTMFIASPVSVLYGNGIVPADLISKVDSVVCLNIFNNVKGKTLAPGNLNYKIDFSNTILLILTLLGLFYGYDSMQHREYFKFRTSLKSHKKIYLAVIGSKFVLFMLAFLVLYAVLVVQMKIYGIHLFTLDYAALLESLLTTILLLLIFFSSGVIIGALGLKSFLSAFFIFAAWFGLIFIIPAAINFIIENKMPDSIEDYQTELDKIDVVAQFEKSFKDKHGEFSRSNMEVARQYIEEYWNVDYKEIEAREEKLRDRFAEAVDDYNLLSIFSPVNNYLLTCSEVSSRGYQNFLAYYRFNQELQKRFVRFYIDRTFYNDPKVMVNFLDKEDPIYRAKSALPPYYHWRILVNALYCLILLLVSYYRFKKYLFPISKDAEDCKKIDLHFNKGKIHILTSYHEEFTERFINLFFGMDNCVNGNITIDGKNILDGEKKNFTYLPPIEDIPEDIPNKSIVKLFNVPTAEFTAIIDKKFGELNKSEQADLLLNCALLRKSSICILNDFLYAPPEYWITYNQKIEALKKTCALIYISRTGVINLERDGNWIIFFDPENRTYYSRDASVKDNQ